MRIVGHDSEREADGRLVVGVLGAQAFTNQDRLSAAVGGRHSPLTDRHGSGPGTNGELVLRSSDVLAVHNGPYDLGALQSPPGERTPAAWADTLGLSWLDDERPPHGLKHLARRRLGRFLDDPITVVGGAVMFAGAPIAQADPAAVLAYCQADADATADLAAQYLSELPARLRRWWWEVEEPHARSCVATGRLGLPIDVAALGPTLDLARARADEALTGLRSLAGWDINPSSPDQVAGWLYEPVVWRRERRLEGAYRTGRECWRWRRAAWPGLGLPGGPSTRADGLVELGHPAADAVLAHREWSKLVGTYLEPMRDRVDGSGRLHPRLNPWGTLTGRISCSGPNLQTLPARRESGRLIRRLVRAPEGRALVIADYSQLEPRIMADLAGMPVADDEHQALADRLGIGRTLAKEVGLASRYGAGPAKLAARLRIPERDARSFLDGFWTSAPELARWRARVVADVSESGVVELPSGRRRHLPEVTLSRSPKQSGAVRQAVNVWCQGTAADVVRVAVADLWRAGVVPALQVHDSVVLEVDERDAADAADHLRAVMQAAGPRAGVGCPLPVDVKVVDRWE